MEWLVGLAFVVLLGSVVASRFRQVRALWQRNRDRPETMNDDWDPFA